MSEIERDLRKLARLLDEERAALRNSDMNRIGQLGPRKLALVERLEAQAGDPPPGMARLSERIAQGARRNQQLIASALEGVRDAQELIARARVPRRHETYSRDGLRQKIDSAPGQLERRA
jgi:flagellar biosynthesis/type III secretory pathway chaperone